MRRYRHGWVLAAIWAILCALVACSAAPTATPAAVATTSPPPIVTTAPLTPTTVAAMPTATPLASTATGTRAAAPTMPTGTPVAGPPTPIAGAVTLLVTNFGGGHVSWVDPARGVFDRVEVGTAPWGLVLGRGTGESGSQRAYVSTAEGIAVVDTAARRLVARVPYLAAVGPPGFGEYRAGGMGLALSPDGSRLYVGVNLPGGNGRLEVLDTAQLRIIGGATVGMRPFDVVASRDGRFVYSIDHDSFGVTIVETATLATRTVAIAPAGRDAFAKPHYGAIGPDDRLLLPIAGRYLVGLGADGAITLAPLTANTHQHGTAIGGSDGRRLLIVGTGPAGGATGRASLTIVALATGAETILPLAREHEKVAVSPDGRLAYLTGGYTLTGGGWDGITVLDLTTGVAREVAVPDLPLVVAVLR